MKNTKRPCRICGYQFYSGFDGVDLCGEVCVLKARVAELEATVLNAYRAFVIGGSPYCVSEARRLLSGWANANNHIAIKYSKQAVEGE